MYKELIELTGYKVIAEKELYWLFKQGKIKVCLRAKYYKINNECDWGSVDAGIDVARVDITRTKEFRKKLLRLILKEIADIIVLKTA